MKKENNIAVNLNGYRVVYQPTHHRAMTNENWEGFVYEHIVVAEKMLGRSLNEKEVVHHLNGDRSNNRKENLLVLERSQHGKLHTWLAAGAPYVETLSENRENSLKSAFHTPQFCKCCGITLQLAQENYCSKSCSGLARRKIERPSKQQLTEDLNNMSIVKVGNKYSVSDNAVRKWMLSYGIKKTTMSGASGTLEERAETSGEV